MYVNLNYYKRKYKNKVDWVVVRALLDRAHGIINSLTFNRIQHVGFENLTDFQQKQVQLAASLMVEHFMDASNSPSHEIQSYSMDGMRVWKQSRNALPWEVAGCGKEAWLALLETGLMAGVL
ncbi:MAG: hypothetical protein FWC69_01185 [Defluviitaleaceae bacterium]|nr:hypothetical protein [Defluviitaleaceae bacterium]